MQPSIDQHSSQPCTRNVFHNAFLSYQCALCFGPVRVYEQSMGPQDFSIPHYLQSFDSLTLREDFFNATKH